MRKGVAMWNAAKGAAAAVMAIAILGGGAPHSVEAQSNCQWYATTALKQQKENERLKCGFKGLSWHSDMRAHLSWCASVPPDQWRSEARKRDQELATCAGKAGR